MLQIWTEKYRPSTLDQYVFQNPEQEKLIRSYIARGYIDNLFLYGPAGVGKTSLFNVLVNELNVDESDVLKINASRDGTIDVIRDRVRGFIMSGGWGAAGSTKLLLLDEAEGITPQAQAALKADMEEFSQTVRWVLTSNSEHRVIKPIRDRCVCIHIDQPDPEKYLERLVEVLLSENIDVTDASMEALDIITKKHYPSVRGAVRDLQNYCIDGKLEVPTNKAKNEDLYLKAYQLFEKQQIKQARELLCKGIAKEDIEGVFVWLYQNISLFKNQDESILVINEGLKAAAWVADGEINLSATLTQLAMINRD